MCTWPDRVVVAERECAQFGGRRGLRFARTVGGGEAVHGAGGGVAEGEVGEAVGGVGHFLGLGEGEWGWGWE